VAVAVLLALGVTGVATAVAGARTTRAADVPTPTSYDASAAADGVRIGVFINGFPLVNQVVDVGMPSAQAVLNALGKSQAFAAMPYPGDAVLTLPGTLFPLVGAPPPPSYPLIASSDATTSPQASVNQVGLSMSAKSDEHSSTAKVMAGGGGGVSSTEADATSKLDPGTGELTATSESTTEVVTVQGVLRLGRVDATAQVTQAPNSNVKTASSFSAEGVTIAGVSTAVSDKGIVLPGRTTPVPDTTGLSPVLDAAGVSMKVVPVDQQPNSIVSAGLVVSVKETGPTGNAIVTYTLGRASASAAASFETVPSESAAGPTVAGSTAGTESTGAGGQAVTGDTGGPGALATTSPSLSTGVAATPRPRTTTGRTTPGLKAVALAGAASSTTSAASFYLVLVVGAAVAASGLVLVRLFGVKLLWT
jgi:hypothetical protein